MTNRTTVLGLAAVLQVGLANVPPASAARVKRECINRKEITTLRALDDKHVYVKAGSSRHYLVTTDGGCRELSEARTLQVIESSTRVCPDSTSLIGFEHPAAGPMRCRIATIEAVKGLADAEERAAEEVPGQKQP